jgi:hypothetical protein
MDGRRNPARTELRKLRAAEIVGKGPRYQGLLDDPAGHVTPKPTGAPTMTNTNIA